MGFQRSRRGLACRGEGPDCQAYRLKTFYIHLFCNVNDSQSRGGEVAAAGSSLLTVEFARSFLAAEGSAADTPAGCWKARRRPASLNPMIHHH